MLAGRQRAALLGQHLRDHCADPIHEVLAAIGTQDGHGTRGVVAPTQRDRLCEFGHLVGAELLETLQSPLLLRICADEVLRGGDFPG